MTADRLLLWRHGRTASNAADRFQGQLDVPLDDVGRVQVKDAAELLAERIADRPCRIISSDLSRAHETALALAGFAGIPVTLDARLREVSVGRWQGLLHGEVKDVDPDGFAAWLSGDDIAVGGGERRSEAAARAAESIEEHARAMAGGVLVAASHGAALRGAVQRLIGLATWSPHLLGGLRNAHWAELGRRGHRWYLDRYNLGPREGNAALEG
ncbi:MAG TPA: histidine phosphatase family protein [Kineosporiaceae bacterium]